MSCQRLGALSITCLISNVVASPDVTPTTRYETLVDQGRLSSDPHQQSIVDRLQHLHDQLVSYNQKSATPSSQPGFVSSVWLSHVFQVEL